MILFVILTIENDEDRAFMESIYDSYRWLMYSEIKKILSNESDIEDVQQESLIKLMGKISLLTTLNRDKTINYIITTCRNTSLNFIRDKKHTAGFSYEDGLDSLTDVESPNEDLLIYAERREHIKQAWDALDERSRHALELKYVLDTPDLEIAKEFGISVPSVRMLLSRSRGKLKQLLDSE